MLKKRIAFSFSLPANCSADGRRQARAGLCAHCAEAVCKVAVPCQNSKAGCFLTMPPAASGRQLRALPQRCPFLFEVFAPRQPLRAVAQSPWIASRGCGLWSHPSEEAVQTAPLSCSDFRVMVTDTQTWPRVPPLLFCPFVIFINFLHLSPCLCLLEVTAFLSVLWL